MNETLSTVVLGIIEGVTEFLPVSSTGHLLIAEHWLGARSELFNVAIQSGAILAVVAIYWQRILDLALHLAQPQQRAQAGQLALAFAVTAAGGLTAKKLGFNLPETVRPVAWALVAGGGLMLLIERWVARQPERAEISWRAAFWTGAAQVLAAVFPGTSRSAATIFAAMLSGCTQRAKAAEFAFLLGIPTMFAATGFELLKLRHAQDAAHEPLGQLALGFAVSAVVAFVSVRWLLAYIQTHRFTAFAWYRIAFGAVLLLALR